MSAKLFDRFEFERVLWRQNLARVAGVDEAGLRANQGLLFRRREIMVKGMSAVELAIEKIKALPETKAKALLDWLAQWEQPRKPAASVHGAAAVYADSHAAFRRRR